MCAHKWAKERLMWIYETLSHCLTFVYGAIKSQLKFNSLVPPLLLLPLLRLLLLLHEWEINGRSHLYTSLELSARSLSHSHFDLRYLSRASFLLQRRCDRALVHSSCDTVQPAAAACYRWFYCCCVLAYLIWCHSVFRIFSFQLMHMLPIHY